VYDILTRHFKEGTSIKKADDLLVPVGQLHQLSKEESQEKIRDIFLRLRSTMGPPIDPFILKRDLLPFSIKDREEALFARASQLGYDPKHIKYMTKIGHYYSDNNSNDNLELSKSITDTCIPYLIEVAVMQTYSLPYYLTYCEGINAAPNHYHSFTDGYSLEWTTKGGTEKQAYGAYGLLKEYGYSSNGNGRPEKERSIILVSLWCPKLQYIDYGKSEIDLNPFYPDLVQLLFKVCSGSRKHLDGEGNKLEAKGLFADYLIRRYKDVLKEPNLKNTDSWNTSTPVYRFRAELERHGIHVERKYLQSLVKTICDEMHELRLLQDSTYIQTGKLGVKREALGIYEAARAFIYFRGNTYDVSFKQLETVKKIATFILIIEKEGVAELLTYWADKYGIAICYTKGFLTDNAKEFSKLATKEGARLALLTDNDFSGWAMAWEVPDIARIGIKVETLEKLNILIEEVVEDLPKPKNSKGVKGYRDSRHAATAEKMYNDGLIPYKDWKLLTGGRYGRRIEIDNVIAYAGAEKFWNEFILSNFKELFSRVNYSLSMKIVSYVSLSNLVQLNGLAEKIGTIIASDKANTIESEYSNYDLESKGFIKDIKMAELENEIQIRKEELNNENIQWLEEQLGLINEELSKRIETLSLYKDKDKAPNT
jgi:hypothetical protein